MKKVALLFLIFLMGTTAASALAVDIGTLDRVHVLMPKAKVLSLLGHPDDTTQHGAVKVDVYRVTNAMPLMRSGCFYDGDRLVGQSFVFQGNSAREVAERLKKGLFSTLEGKGTSLRLVGRDDDTGRPLVAIVTENDGLTTVTTFEKGFYDKRVK